jgi:hypothetical protein
MYRDWSNPISSSPSCYQVSNHCNRSRAISCPWRAAMLVQPISTQNSKRLSIYKFSIVGKYDRNAAVGDSKYHSSKRAESKVRTRDFVAGNRKSRRLTYPGSFIGQIPAEAIILEHAKQSIWIKYLYILIIVIRSCDYLLRPQTWLIMSCARQCSSSFQGSATWIRFKRIFLNCLPVHKQFNYKLLIMLSFKLQYLWARPSPRSRF